MRKERNIEIVTYELIFYMDFYDQTKILVLKNGYFELFLLVHLKVYATDFL